MAEALDFKPPPRDPRVELLHKLERAPAEHAEALLDAYEILTLLREKGVLEIAKGALGAGELVVGAATQTLESEGVVTFLRNLTTLTKILGGIDPALLDDVQASLLAGAASERKPPGFFRLLAGFFRTENRAALAVISGALSAIGKHLLARTAAQDVSRPHKVTRRHEA